MAFLLIGAGFVMAQTQVQGTVVDEQGEPVIGASIVLKTDRTRGTISDIDGKFTLSVPNGSTLVFSFVGFKTQEAVAQPNMKITMMGDTETLDEVIVVAYGTAKKSSFTGSAAAVSAEKLSSARVESVDVVAMSRSGVSALASCRVIEPTPPAAPISNRACAAPGTGMSTRRRSKSVSQAVSAVSGRAAASAKFSEAGFQRGR